RDPAHPACADRSRDRRVRAAARPLPLRRRPVMPAGRMVLLIAVASVLGGCGGAGSSTPTLPTVQAARMSQLAGFEPAGTVVAGRPVTVAFTIRQPDGKPLTDYRRGTGPHTG